jgi:hypothetical protein
MRSKNQKEMDEWSDLIENYEIEKEKERKEARKQRNKEKK